MGINSLGQWYAQGYSMGGPDSYGSDDVEPIRQAQDDDYDRSLLFEGMPLGQNECVVWVEAEIPLPEETSVRGTVVDA